jgi:branched-chain amino acid transport system substrate-binding protein
LTGDAISCTIASDKKSLRGQSVPHPLARFDRMPKKEDLMSGIRKLVAFVVAALCAPMLAIAQDAPIKIGVVSFLSGPAAGPFGVPARNAAELTFEMLNGGKVPAPYATKGFGGAKLQMVLVDESGGTTTQVTEFRNMVQRDNVDLVIGYISSGSCLGIAPVAEELKTLTVFFDCGTPRIFEERDYKYVFRTASTATMDSVGAALYVKDLKPNAKIIAGVNQNYAWGQDSWGDFELSMKQIFPNIQVATSQMPKLFAGQYNAEISTLLSAKADVVHSSFWDGDLEAFILQSGPRGLFKRSTVILTTGETAMYKLADKIPDGVVLGARGPYGPYAPDNELNKWYTATFEDRYNVPPNYAAYQMTQAILGTKAAWEKAQAANGGKRPSIDQVIAAFERLTFTSPAGEVRMAIGKGHQAITETAYGVSKKVGGKMTVANVKRYPAEMVNPPDGVKSADWIKNGFKK